MAKLTAADLKKLPDSDFAYIDSKGERSLPIPDADHVRDAMARFDQQEFESDDAKQKARQKILARAKKFGIDVANFSGAEPNPAIVATFASTVTEDGDTVIRTGKVFEAGDYPDKHFSLNADEMDRAIASFAPVALDIGDGHIPTVLEGKAGRLERVWKGEDGHSLMGEVRLPRWLDSLLEDGERKVSTEWNRATKTLHRLCLVKDPRVSDAVLMSAYVTQGGPPEQRDGRMLELAMLASFAAPTHNTPSGQMALQSIHDVAARSGAVCKRPASMASSHEATAIQQVHDMTIQHGASCESMTDGRGYGSFSRTHSDKSPRRARMNFREWLTGKAQEDGIEIDEAELSATFSSDADTKIAALEAELAKRDAAAATLQAQQQTHAEQLARFAAERRQAEAVTFAQTQVSAHRVTPGAAEKLTTLVERLASLDETATFAEGQSTATALLTAFVESLPDLSVFTTEHIKRDEVAALFTTQTTADPKTQPNMAMVDKVLAATPDGRAVLAARKNGS